MKTNPIGWVARVLSLLGVGHYPDVHDRRGLQSRAYGAARDVLCLFFPIGVCVGMIVGWFREGLGRRDHGRESRAVLRGTLRAVGLSSRRVGVPHLLVGRADVPLSWLYTRLRARA